MQIKLFSFIACITTLNITAQPYVDPLNIRYTRAFHNNDSKATPFSHLYIGSDLPLRMKKNRIIVLSPFYENWNIDSASNKSWMPEISSIAFAVSAIIPLDKDHWSFALTAIPRFNSEALNLQNSFQMGGLLLAIYKRNENLKYRVGVYANNEFFGLFVIPLVGIDWKINSRDNLFGILPGKLTFEHQLNNYFYTGATFRAITNSYRLIDETYLRIDDNQLSAFLDFYATKHIVFTGEAGYGIFRKLRSGTARNKNYTTDHDWGDGLFIKLCTAYRIRL